MAVLSVGDAIECTHASKSSGTFSVPIEVGWQGKVKMVSDFDAFIEFQNHSQQRTTALWVRANEFGNFVIKTSCSSDDNKGESELEESSFCERQCTAEESNTKLEAVGGF